MRFPSAVQLLCATPAAVSASVLASPMSGRQLVDLSRFGSGFNVITIEDAKAAVAKNNVEHANLTNPTINRPSPSPPARVGTIDGGSSPQEGSCSEPKVRIEWRMLNDDQRMAFVKAVRCLIDAPPSGEFSAAGSQNRYEDLVAVHVEMSSTIHTLAQFLPWHRYYLNLFETMLREECSYTGPMTWWDETQDAGKFGISMVFSTQWFGSAPEKTADNEGTCITDGEFAGMTIHIGGDHCLSRSLDESITSSCNTDFVNTCNSNNLYSDMAVCSELGPHGYGHNGIGAVMSQVPTSPNDPVFFLHHGFVDHSWVLWQNLSTNRLTEINGCSDKESPCTRLTSDYVLTSLGLRPNVTINDVLDTTGGYLCYTYDS